MVGAGGKGLLGFQSQGFGDWGLCDGEGGRTEGPSCAKGASGDETAHRAPGVVSSQHPTLSEVQRNGSARYRDVRVPRC